MVPTYGTKGTRRYCYYETRKDLAKPGSPSATRYQRGQLERHVVEHVVELLEDEHRLRRLTGIEDAEPLRVIFIQAKLLAAELQHRSRTEAATRSILPAIRIAKDHIMVELHLEALTCQGSTTLGIRVPLLTRKPFREAKLRIDGVAEGTIPDEQLIKRLADAAEAQRLVLGSPELSLNTLGKREGRCRTQLGRLLRLSWLSQRIVELIAAAGNHVASRVPAC